MKSLSIDNKIRIAVAGVITIVGIFSFVFIVHANPAYFAQGAKSSSATSTPQFLIPNSSQGTSTPVVYDSYNQFGTNQSPNSVSPTLQIDAADSLALMEYVQASTTSTVFKTFIEYSDGVDASGNSVDCKTNPGGCDWYENNLDTYAAGSIAIAVPNTYSYTYASTSILQTSSPANETRGFKLIGIKTPLRFVRAYVVISGANGSVSLKFAPKKQLK